MVSQILMLLALATTTPVESSGGARAEAQVRVTIQRGAMLQAERMTSDARALPAIPSTPRACRPADTAAPDCRLIVYDLP